MRRDLLELSQGQPGGTKCRGGTVKVGAGETVRGRPDEVLGPGWTGMHVEVLLVWGAGAGWWGPKAGDLSRQLE